MGKRCFDSCYELSDIDFSSLEYAGEGAFIKCTSLTDVYFQSLKEVSDGLFSKCSSLKSVNLPSAIKSEEGSFSFCTSLKNVSIPNLQNLGNNTFESCSSLECVEFHYVTNVNIWAFTECTNLKSVSLPSATNIKNAAFAFSSNLTSVSLHSVTNLSPVLFYDCVSLKLLDFGGELHSQIPSCNTQGGYRTFDNVPTNQLSIVVPDSQYDEWISAPQWVDLYNGGAKFYKYSEWEAPHRYEIGYAICATNETFSNAVLSVGLNIDTNTVAAINALVESGEELPIGGATTVGVLILALAAAIAGLKRKKADKSDLPYAMVTPGEWEFSDGETHVIVPDNFAGDWKIYADDAWPINESGTYATESEAQAVLDTLTSCSFTAISVQVTATRASLPGHLIDRAVNAVPVTGATTLTLPALVNAGKSRDLLVRLTVSADSAVTFSAPTGETITWDDAGSPTATYEAGTHLLRFTEVGLDNGSYIFHFTDLGDGAVLKGKLEATSAAPAFDQTKTYSAGEHVTYNGVLYECSTAVTTAGAWTGSTNWTATDMTSPDATLDLMADGRLRLVSADGEVLWMQGYGLASASSVTLSCDKVNFHAFAAAPAFDATAAYDANDLVAYDGVVYVFTAAHAAGAWTGSDASVYAVALAIPTAPSGKVGDFVLDVDNTANASASVTATLTGAGTAFDVFTPEGVNLSTDILTFAGGEQCELYFTMTAFGTAAKPAWKVVKQVVEKQEFGS